MRIVPFAKGKKEILHAVEGPGRHEQALAGSAWTASSTRQQPKCNIKMAVRVQAPLSMGILSHRENKVALFDKEKQSIVL